jgi:choline dehydrogenase-like flavoprotein
VFVLAAGGIENPRLLLASRTRHPAGLGNEHDLVGRFFMEHLHVFSGKIVPQSLDAALIDTYRRRTRQGTDVTGMLTIAPGRRQAERIAGASAILSAEDASSASPGMHAIRELLAARRNNIVRGNLSDVRNSFADREHRAALLRLIKPLSAVPSDWRSVTMTALRHLVRRPAKPTLFQMLLNVEQVPNQRSRVTLAPVRDSLGTFRAELDWRLTTQDRRTIVTTERVIDTSLRAAGTGHLEGAYDGEKPLPLTGSWHHMGTTRMHDDPQQGVVDASSRVHGMSNLYVAGSSVFPTGGYTNPTLTIVALALRLADHLAAEHTKTPTLK